MASNNFQKFIKQEDKGAKLKEKIRQEKKKARQETKEFFERKKQESRNVRDDRNTPSAEGTTSHKKRTNTGKKVEIKPSAAAKKTAAELVTRSGSSKTLPPPRVQDTEPGEMQLNKFVAHAGVCSRRDAAALVKSGKVSVNGTVITEPGTKVSRKDDVRVQGKKITAGRNLVYILLNKPKDHITTTEDPQGRKTVMDIVKNATKERLFPVGRLDRNTTGVLLLTNDGELAQKLAHPSYEIRKIYEVTLDRPLAKKDLDELSQGIHLEDGFIAPDSVAYADARDKSVIGIEIHSGKNRIVRRMFEKLGYDVRNLDRVMYANLTKKNVERGKYRFLQEKEIRLLKFMNASYGKKKA